MHSKISVVALCTLLSAFSAAHPGEDHSHEVAARAAWLNSVERRDLSHCAEKLKARGIHSKSALRRREMAQHLRQKRGLGNTPFLPKRDLDSVLSTSHHSDLTGLSADDTSTIFSSNSSCILNPETTEGPYYVQGELIREDVTEGQEGVPLAIDILLLDIATCEPITDAYLDFWHCNSTGVYSGVAASNNLDETFLRGLQPADEDGVVMFNSLFPGHYQGRATHIHIMAHLGATKGDNDTLSSQGSIAHVGQIFFDQDLISEVEKESPYTTNTQELTENADDDILATSAEDDADPFAEYVYLGDSISDGILAWTTIGINMTTNSTVSVAANYYEDGGVANENSGMGGGPGGMGGPPGEGGPGGMNGTANGTVTANDDDSSSGSSSTSTGLLTATGSSTGSSSSSTESSFARAVKASWGFEVPAVILGALAWML